MVHSLPKTNSHFAPENRPFNAPISEARIAFQPSIFRCFWLLLLDFREGKRTKNIPLVVTFGASKLEHACQWW